MKRVLDVAKIQLTNWPSLLAYPLGLVASLSVLGLVIDVSNGDVSGANHPVILLPTIYLAVATAHLQTMTQGFPFAVGLSVTRRTFYAAATLVVAGYAMLFGLVLLGFLGIERGTGGWGRHLQVFDLDYLRQGNAFAQWLVFTVPFLAVSSAAVCAGLIFQRWRQPGIYLATMGGLGLVAGLGVLVSTQGWWPAIGRFFTGQPTIALFAGYPLVIALAFGGVGWLTIRRATP